MCAAAAFFIFLPFLVVDKGLFQYCGDFNSQQIPFYTYMNGFVKNSAGQWSWETDLGTSAGELVFVLSVRFGRFSG